MPSLEGFSLPLINTADGTITLPLWAAAIAAVLLLMFVVLALIRTGFAGTLVFTALVGFGVWGAWAWSDHERGEQRRALEQRLAALEAQASAPASALACLDPAGETIEASCEHTIFATAETAAAAVSFTSARLLLLQDGLALAARDASLESTIESLRKTLERDRYGVVAQVLTARNGCSPESCDALRLLRDSARVRTNMRDHTFEANVSRYAAAWPTRAAASASPVPNVFGAIPGTVAAPVPPRYTLPSAASIPPVSIMNNEPPVPPSPAPGAQSPATSAAPAAPPQRRAPPPRAQAPNPAPIPLAPPPPRP